MHPSAGGPPRVLVGHALQMKALGHEPVLVGGCLPGQRDEVLDAWPVLTQAGIESHVFELNKPYALGRSAELRAALSDLIAGVDVVHAHGLWTGLLVDITRAAKANGIPYIVHPHGMLDHYSRKQGRVKKFIAGWLMGAWTMVKESDVMLYGTQDELKEAEALAPNTRHLVVPNGIDPSKLHREPGEDTEPLFEMFPHLRDRWPILLFYSRFHPKKGLDLLIDAFAQVASEFPQAGLLAAGIAQDAEYERMLVERIAQTDLRDRVALTSTFTAERGKIPLNASHVFALTSHQEGFSMAIVEAMACGMPIFISDRCHMEVIQEVQAGWVVPTDRSAIADALRELLACDAQQLQAMGERARQHAVKEYSWESVGAKLERIYNEMTGTGR